MQHLPDLGRIELPVLACQLGVRALRLAYLVHRLLELRRCVGRARLAAQQRAPLQSIGIGEDRGWICSTQGACIGLCGTTEPIDDTARMKPMPTLELRARVLQGESVHADAAGLV